MNPSQKLFAVAGVTGHTGGAVANTLLERGAKVRVIVRSEEKGAPWKERGAEVAVADLGDAPALTRALEGAHGAYLLGPPEMGAEDFMASRRPFIDAARAAIDASGIAHVVYLSSVGAQHEKGTGVIRSTHVAEKSLEGAGAAMTFVRACYFIENWGEVLPVVTSDGVLPSMWSPADRRIDHVATKDIGRVAAEALLDGPGSGNRIIELSGPEKLSPNDIAGILSDLTGRDVTVSLVPPEAQVETFQSFGISRSGAEAYHEMFRAIESGLVDWEGGDAEHVRATTTAREVLTAMLG